MFLRHLEIIYLLLTTLKQVNSEFNVLINECKSCPEEETLVPSAMRSNFNIFKDLAISSMYTTNNEGPDVES